MKTLRMLALVLFAVFAPGCAGCWASIPAVLLTVMQDVSEAAAVLNAVQSAADAFFAVKPDADAQAKVNKAISATNYALDAGIRATRGAQNLTDAQAIAAFAEFAAAWADLQQVMKTCGVLSNMGLVGASPKTPGIVLRTPILAMARR
jgi:biotin carboxylase